MTLQEASSKECPFKDKQCSHEKCHAWTFTKQFTKTTKERPYLICNCCSTQFPITETIATCYLCGEGTLTKRTRTEPAYKEGEYYQQEGYCSLLPKPTQEI